MVGVWSPKYYHCFRPFRGLPGKSCGSWLKVAKAQGRSLVRYLVVAVVIFFGVLWIGKTVQDRRTRRAPSTIGYYQTPKVCGLVVPSGPPNNDTSVVETKSSTFPQKPPSFIKFATFPTEEDARSDPDVVVAHCGDCGMCSNPRDVLIYDDTKHTMLETATSCGIKGVFLGRNAASRCMEDRVGFTTGCNDCWIDNMMCDIRHCLFTCLWHFIFDSRAKSDEGGNDINDCLLCDERMCGPDFLDCAGANRRRTGIKSSIERNEDLEVCTAVDAEWWKEDGIQLYWTATEDYRATTTKARKHKQKGNLRPIQ